MTSTTVSEEAVKAMPKRIYAAKKTEGSNCVVSFDTPSLDYNVEYVRADLALPHLPGVGVKKLEWRKYRNGDAEAVTPFGEIYTAYVNGYWRITRNGKAGKFIKATGGDDVDAAKAGAQADFDANVLPLVRSQAEELLAAERAKYRDAMEKLVESQRETLVWQQQAIDLKADNAAKDARVKELEKDFYDADKSDISARDLLNDQDAKIEALEAKLAAAEKALEPFALISSEGVIKQESGHVTVITCAEYFHNARAVLGGKPS